jgi:hypothetical protein
MDMTPVTKPIRAATAPWTTWITPELRERHKAIAAVLNISMAELLRRYAEAGLQEAEQELGRP